MKNKRLLCVLLPLVFGIWGIIVYKIIHHLNRGEDVVKDTTPVISAASKQPMKDTVLLILDYRDPFLHGMIRLVNTSMESDGLLSNRNGLSSEVKPMVNFPPTKYFGVVVNSKNKQKLGLLKVDNKDYLVKEGEIAAGEKIIKLYTDSVVILFNKSRKSFFKNKTT